MKKNVEIIVPCFSLNHNWASELIDKFLIFRDLCTVLKTDSLKLTIVLDGPVGGFPEIDKLIFTELLPEANLIFYEKNRGKGHALRAGVAQSDADYMLLTDADFPYKLASMFAVLKKTMENGGIIAGFREADYYDDVPVFRKILSKSLRFLLKNGLRLPVTDSQCGLKAFDRTGRDVFLKTTIDRFLFDLEFLVLATKSPAIKITPVPVTLREGVVFGKVGLRVLATEFVNFLKIILKG